MSEEKNKELLEKVEKVEKQTFSFLKKVWVRIKAFVLQESHITFVKSLLKKVVYFLLGFFTLYFLWRIGMYLFPGTIGDGTIEAKTDIVTFWITAWTTIKETFKSVVKDIFLNLHQAIVLFFVGWIFTGVRKIWKRVQGKVDNLLDTKLVSMAQEKRERLKRHLNAIVTANIDLVEGAFASIGGQNNDVEAQRAHNEEKLAAALTMTVHDLVKDKVGQDIVKDYTHEEVVQLLVCEIEKNLLTKKLGAKTSATLTPFTTAAAGSERVSKNSANRLRHIIAKTNKTLPEGYQKAIKNELKAD